MNENCFPFRPVLLFWYFPSDCRWKKEAMMVVGFECKFHFPAQSAFVLRGTLSCWAFYEIIVVIKLGKHQKDYMPLREDEGKLGWRTDGFSQRKQVYVLKRKRFEPGIRLRLICSRRQWCFIAAEAHEILKIASRNSLTSPFQKKRRNC